MHAMAPRLAFLISLVLTTPITAADATPRGDQAVIQLLQSNACRSCHLADVDLVHAQLQDADLESATLQRANLSQAQLDGANLRNTDLSFTSLQGASLRGANLQGSRLVGTDLRDADLSGALLDTNALEEAHWSGSKGLPTNAQSHAALHNAGVTAAEAERWSHAEELFGFAIRKEPATTQSWVARAISREKLGKRQLAIQDFTYASQLAAEAGDTSLALQLSSAAQALEDKTPEQRKGNGAGSALLNSLVSTSQALLPIAMKLFLPAVGF